MTISSQVVYVGSGPINADFDAAKGLHGIDEDKVATLINALEPKLGKFYCMRDSARLFLFIYFFIFIFFRKSIIRRTHFPLGLVCASRFPISYANFQKFRARQYKLCSQSALERRRIANCQS